MDFVDKASPRRRIPLTITCTASPEHNRDIWLELTSHNEHSSTYTIPKGVHLCPECTATFIYDLPLDIT